MSDDKSKSKEKPADSSKVNADLPHEMEYWSKELEVSTHILHDTIKKVGGIISDIKSHLKKG